jgi:Cap4 dsDNA endonuclease
MKVSDENQPSLAEVTPRETSGRDTIARYQAQFRAAAYECLSILTGKTIDRVYCDYHDDFVSREAIGEKRLYHFYQVKTKEKRNYQWKRLDIFGMPKKKTIDPEKVVESFAGKLILHTVRFKNSCGNVVFLTNIQFDDEMEGVAAALEAGDFTNETLKLLIGSFNEAFIEGVPLDATSIQKHLGRLSLRPGIEYLHPQAKDFEALARDAIFNYSEVDLEHLECEEIIRNLVGLVERKSFQDAIAGMSESQLDDIAGIGISDMLEILSISKGAYQQLIDGGDPTAIKSASIIQRKLTQAGAGDEIIEYCSKWKVQWDIWFRDKRHMLPEFELNFLLDDLNNIKNMLATGKVSLQDLQSQIESLWTKVFDKGLSGTLSKDLLMGGVFSALVRSEAQ